MRELRPLSAVLPLSLLLLWSWTSVAYAETNGYRVFWPDGAGPHPAIAFLSGCSGFAPVGARKFYERVAETLGQEGYVVLFMEYVGRRGLQSCASAPMVSEDAAKDHSPFQSMSENRRASISPRRMPGSSAAMINRDFILDGVRKAVEALAAPGETALATMPEGSVKADELALDFENFGRAAFESRGSEMTEVQRESLRNIDRLLSAMSGGHQADLWTEEAVRTHPKWREVRDAARRALIDFGWEGHTGNLSPIDGHLRRYTGKGLSDVSFAF